LKVWPTEKSSRYSVLTDDSKGKKKGYRSAGFE
jgi:hypothetical protein